MIKLHTISPFPPPKKKKKSIILRTFVQTKVTVAQTHACVRMTLLSHTLMWAGKKLLEVDRENDIVFSPLPLL